MVKKLSIKRELFCNHYIECGNASEAYRLAYTCSSKWKDGVVRRKASELMKIPEVNARIEELQDEAKKRFDMKKDDALRFLASIIDVDPLDLGKVEGDTFTVNSMNDIPESVRRCIQSIRSTKDGIEVKLYSKIAALSQISKMLGWDAPVKNESNTSIRMIIGDD